MRKNIRIPLAMCIIIIVATSLLSWSFAKPPQFEYKNSLVVNRNFDTTDEEHALTIAEIGLDYSAIIRSVAMPGKSERFNGSSDPEAYIHPGTYLAYTWANSIDLEVIDYYQNRYDYQQDQKAPKGVTFTYNAKVTYLEQLHISNITQFVQSTGTSLMEDGTWQNQIFTRKDISIVFYGSDDSSPLTTVRPFEYMFCKNQSGYYALPSEFDLNFSNCYLVEMELEYDEYYAPL
jgi:hypothetical protein